MLPSTATRSAWFPPQPAVIRSATLHRCRNGFVVTVLLSTVARRSPRFLPNSCRAPAAESNKRPPPLRGELKKRRPRGAFLFFRRHLICSPWLYCFVLGG